MDLNRTLSEYSLFHSPEAHQVTTHQLPGRQTPDRQLPAARSSSGQPAAARSFFQRVDDTPVAAAQVKVIQADVAERETSAGAAAKVDHKQRSPKARPVDKQRDVYKRQCLRRRWQTRPDRGLGLQPSGEHPAAAW